MTEAESRQNDYVEETNEQQTETDISKSSKTASQSAHVSEYVVSWKWLISGLSALLIAGGLIGGLYYYRLINLSSDVLNVVQKMKTEAEEYQKEADKLIQSKAEPEKIHEVRQKAYNTRSDALNLLLGFNRRPNQEGNVKVLTEINEFLESLIPYEAGSPTLLHRRQNQLMENCKQLIQAISSEEESFPYQLRLMELEWDQRNLTGVLDRAKTVLQIDQKRGRENYDALRYIALASLARLATVDYHQQIPAQMRLPERMDGLLDKVLQMRPDNIEIAYRYAEFIIDVNGREEFRKNASDELRAKPQEERNKLASSILDDMVSRNSDNARAYLVRHNFKRRYLKTSDDPNQLDSDIEAVLKINPDDPEGLIQAGLTSFRQSIIAQNAGNTELAKTKRIKAEEYLKHVIQTNPRFDLGYQHLGDFYAAEGDTEKAVQIWNDGVEQNLPMANPELIGRLVIALTNQKKYVEATDKISILHRYLQEIRTSVTTDYARQIQNLANILTARLFAAEGTEAVSKAETARQEGNNQESQRFFSLAQRKTSDATQILEKLFRDFGSPYDYVVDESSIYSKLLGESLILAGRLMADQGKWSQAIAFYEKAMPFDAFRQNASILAAAAYQQTNQPERAVELLQRAASQVPDNMTVRYLYAQSLYRQEVSRSIPSITDINNVEKVFKELLSRADELPNPWMVDIRLIHLEMAKENVSNEPERILKAQQEAIKKFRKLEEKEFPVKSGDEESKTQRTYSDDLGFLSEMAGIYSSLAQISDFDRILQKMRQLPNGEALYYVELVNDSMRRNDRENAVLAVEEALESDKLTQGQKQRFVAMLQNLKDDSTDALDRIYTQLKTTFDRNPDSLKPQAFFLFANLAIDRDDIKQAKVLQERLEQIEGAPDFGTMWRYIKARCALKQSPPDFDEARKLQGEIVALDKNWDMSYLLRASIDEQFLLTKLDDPDIRGRLIESYQMAIRCGNIQPMVWNRLMALYEEVGDREEDIKKLRRDARVRNVRIEGGGGQQFPQPYQRMCDQVHESLEEDPQNADLIARQCMLLAEGRREKPELIFSLNLFFGKMFLDAGMTDSAMRHLRYVARRGGSYVYPLAVALAKAKRIDEGFTMILDEIDRMPSSMGTLVPSLLVLLSQVRPSEAVFLRIDKLMDRIEKGERPVLRESIPNEDTEDHYIDLGRTRRIATMLLRFPENQETPEANTIQILPPEEEEETYDDEESTEMPKTNSSENSESTTTQTPAAEPSEN